MLRDGNLPDDELSGIRVRTLVISSAKDRMLPSLLEGSRLQQLMPNAKRLILPDSGHAALLETGVNLPELMARAGLGRTKGSNGSNSSNGNGSSTGSSSSGSTSDLAIQGTGSSDSESSSAGRMTAAGLSSTQSQDAAATSSSDAGTAIYSNSSSTDASTDNAAAPVSSVAASDATHSSNGNGTSSSNGTSSNRSSSSRRAPLSLGRVDPTWDSAMQTLQPWRELVSPVVLGAQHLPDPASVAGARPLLFVGNHQRMGLYDMPLLLMELYVRGHQVGGEAGAGAGACVHVWPGACVSVTVPARQGSCGRWPAHCTCYTCTAVCGGLCLAQACNSRTRACSTRTAC
jgi:hypothetical protein